MCTVSLQMCFLLVVSLCVLCRYRCMVSLRVPCRYRCMVVSLYVPCRYRCVSCWYCRYVYRIVTVPLQTYGVVINNVSLQMCFLLVVSFAVCWSGYAVVCLWTVFLPPDTVPFILTLLPPLLAKVRSRATDVAHNLEGHQKVKQKFALGLMSGIISITEANESGESGSIYNFPLYHGYPYRKP